MDYYYLEKWEEENPHKIRTSYRRSLWSFCDRCILMRGNVSLARYGVFLYDIEERKGTKFLFLKVLEFKSKKSLVKETERLFIIEPSKEKFVQSVIFYESQTYNQMSSILTRVSFKEGYFFEIIKCKRWNIWHKCERCKIYVMYIRYNMKYTL